MSYSQTKCKITLVKLGYMKRPIDTSVISKWKSGLFDVIAIDEKTYIPNMNSDDWQYLSDTQVLDIISHDEKSDFTIAITEYELEDNFYMRRITEGVSVLSLFEVGDMLQYYNIPLENFIAINLYKMVALLKIYRKLPITREEIPPIIHDETRSCLFDMNGIKLDVIYSTERPNICQRCQVTMKGIQLPHGFLNRICKELKKIRKPRYYRLQDYIKKRPLISIGIMMIGALIIGILANLAYDGILKIWRCLQEIKS